MLVSNNIKLSAYANCVDLQTIAILSQLRNLECNVADDDDIELCHITPLLTDMVSGKKSKAKN